jgi:histidinol phosphatase-like PHP family hydrolase
MQILADYHTHTKYSHGKGTIEENVLEAISKGIKTIGISDHGYKHLAYGIKLNFYDVRIRYLEEWKKQLGDDGFVTV